MEFPSFQELLALVRELRGNYFANLARHLMRDAGLADQRELDYKRGFWQGAIWALNTLPQSKTKEWEAFIERSLKESETA